MKQIVLWAVTAVLLGYSLYYAAFCSFNFGNLCVWGLTAVALGYSVFWRRVDPVLAHGPGRVLKYVVLAGFVFFAVVLGIIIAGQWGRRATGREQALIVLGCAIRGDQPTPVLLDRLEAAYAYYEKNPTVTVVVCGGQGATESMPEGAVMRRWLLEKGVPADQVLLDDTSSSTDENFQNAKALLAQRGIDAAAPVAYVTNGFHCYRSGLYAARSGFSAAAAVPAGLPLGQYLTCYIREVFALVYYWAFKTPDAGFLRGLVGLLWLGGPK